MASRLRKLSNYQKSPLCVSAGRRWGGGGGYVCLRVAPVYRNTLKKRRTNTSKRSLSFYLVRIIETKKIYTKEIVYRASDKVCIQCLEL